MAQQLQPSPFNYDFRSADLRGAQIRPDDVARIILQATQGGGIDATALLAAILKSQKKSNSYYSPIPFGLSAYNAQQIDGLNPMRNFFLVQNVGSGDLMVVFQAGDPVITDYSADANSQNVLNLLQLQSVRIVAGGNFFPDTPPINPITIFTLGTATQGVVVVGS